MPIFTLNHNDKTLGDFHLQTGHCLTIGRRKKNDVVIGDPTVSGHHAKIDSVGEGFVLTDLQSRNGSFVNEQLITTSRWLKNGDIINIGEHSLIFQNYEDAKASFKDTEELNRTMVIDTIQYRNMRKKSNPTRSINVVRFWSKTQKLGVKKKQIPEISRPIVTKKRKETISTLAFLAGGKGKIKLTKKTTFIGKHPESDIVVKGVWVGKSAVSISKRPDGYYLCYLGGLSKPKVNEKPVKQIILLKDCDVIDIGSTKLRFSSKEPQNG
jgi:pSer/pThr/pTyr-binding forkhead associated (FHA) protein